MSATSNPPAGYRFVLDGKEYTSPERVVTGADIRIIAGIEHNVRIFAGDHKNHQPDHQILSHSTVDLTSLTSHGLYTLAEPSMDIY